MSLDLINKLPNYSESSKKEVALNTMGLDVNYANSNKWFAYFPLENILGNEYKGIELHLVRFSLPQQQMGSTTVSFRGYQKEIPTKVMNAETKELTLEYIVDERWKNYKALYAWMSGIDGTFNPVLSEATEKITPTDYLPLRIYLIDNYKQKVIQFLFENCWIKVFNDLSLETSNSNEVTHSFTIVYDNYKIEKI
jgi:hypothetical protein